MLFYENKKIVDNNHPATIERLQNIFIESFCVCVYSIYLISNSPKSIIAGLDNVCFKKPKLFEDRYILSHMSAKKRNNYRFKSSENMETQRNKLISDELKKKFEMQAQIFNTRLCFELIDKCQIKTLRKNYSAQALKRI